MTRNAVQSTECVYISTSMQSSPVIRGLGVKTTVTPAYGPADIPCRLHYQLYKLLDDKRKHIPDILYLCQWAVHQE